MELEALKPYKSVVKTATKQLFAAYPKIQPSSIMLFYMSFLRNFRKESNGTNFIPVFGRVQK